VRVNGGNRIARAIMAHWGRDGETIYRPRPTVTGHPNHIEIDGLTTRSLYWRAPLSDAPVLFSAVFAVTVRNVDRGHRPWDVIVYPGDLAGDYAPPEVAPLVNRNYAFAPELAVDCRPQWEDVP
jgi:hypothetical protein